ITVSVDRPIVIVIAVQRIVAIGWIPVASIQKIVSGGNENDRVTMIVPPISVMPLVPVTTERFVKADIVLLVVRFFGGRVLQRFVRFRLRRRRGLVSRNMPLRIYRRERLILRRDSTAFMH